jgi:hypothetical protein
MIHSLLHFSHSILFQISELQASFAPHFTMRLRNGKICYKFDICGCGQKVNIDDYTPPRIVKVNALLKSVANFIDHQTNQPPKDDTLWSKTDTLLDQISELLMTNANNGLSAAYNLSFAEHCNQLELCNKILRKLQTSTEVNAKFVVKQLNSIENCYNPMLPMCVFLKNTKDLRYKKLLKQEMEVGRNPFYLLFCLKKLRKLYENRLKIAEKYCLLTKRTADLVKYAVEMLRQRYENYRGSLYDKAPDSGTTEESRRKSIIQTSIKPFKSQIPEESCAICLSEMKPVKPLEKPALRIESLEISELEPSEPSSLETSQLQISDSINIVTPENIQNLEDPESIEVHADNTPFHTNKCQHVFHKECLETWLLIKMRCPTCRTPIDPKLMKANSSTQTELTLEVNDGSQPNNGT